MPVDAAEVLSLLVLGLVAGIAGGLLGLGGAIVVVPGLTLFMHRDQHLAQATAMIVNVFVALPALVRHHNDRAVDWVVVARVLPLGVLTISLGVALSNQVDGDVLRQIFGGFLVYVAIESALRLHGGRRHRDGVAPRCGWGSSSVVGGATGFFAGLLGIGGGPIAIPLLRRCCRLSLRDSVPLSTAVICLASAVGAVQKNAALDWPTSLTLAAWLAPTAAAGALFGAGLTRRVSATALRLAFIVLLTWAGSLMLGLLDAPVPPSVEEPALVEARDS